MKAMPLPFEEFQGKGVLDFSTVSSDSLPHLHQHHHHHHHHHQQQQQLLQKWHHTNKENCYVGTEPTSVLDSRRSPSPPTSTSTLSSSLGNGVASTTAAAAAAAPENHHQPSSQTSLDIGEKCGLGMEDWEGVLSDSSSGQEQSILRLIMGDIEDPSLGLNKLLHQDLEFNSGFGMIDQADAFGCLEMPNNLLPSIDPSADFPFNGGGTNATRLGSVSTPNHNPMFSVATSNNLLPGSLSHSPAMFHHQQQQPVQTIEAVDEKPQIFNPQMINPARFAQNPALFMPTYTQLLEHHLVSQPQAKRRNLCGIGPNYQVPKLPLSESEQDFLRRQQQQQQNQLQMQKVGNNELASQQQQQLLFDQLYQLAELIETGNNPVRAQGILARLNHQLSPIGKPFQRAAFYFKEALQLLLRNTNNTNCNASLSLSSPPPPISLIYKIGAYKSFSEVSPVLQFANFTCNQALLEALDGFDTIHIIDFDIGFGGQWSSLMQELALKQGGGPALKITAFSSPSTHDELELGFSQESLKHFATEINLAFEFEFLSLESLNSGSWPLPLRVSKSEAIAVNLPNGSFSNYPLPLPLVLGFVKQLSPKIVFSLDRGCDQTDVPFPLHIIQAVQSYSGLFESLDAVNVNQDALQRIERYLLQPGIEKIVLGRRHSPDRTPPWRSLFLSSGFSPLTFSNFTESQAECLVQRTPVRGFHVKKNQTSLVLCWQRKELISVSVWRC
ncbi:scarecrow-like protein 22 [Castanea sativa]|uniref:scarecrow-like protein 22 n=1 Tax=Castanea sativa TaxID=21020 RepID=UPI003F6521A7